MLKTKNSLPWFAFEVNTGFIDGFYKNKPDVIDTAIYLAERFEGSVWIIAKRSKIPAIGANAFKHPKFWHRDGREKLTQLFGDIQQSPPDRLI